MIQWRLEQIRATEGDCALHSCHEEFPHVSFRVSRQPRQQDILEQVFAKQKVLNPHELSRSLSKYMINLSPFGPEHAKRRADDEAQNLLNDPERLRELLQDLPKNMAQIPQAVLTEIEGKIANLVAVVSERPLPGNEKSRRHAMAAILYLLDPYNAIHDRHGVLGYADDIRVIQEALAVREANVSGNPAPATN
jgi:hypothetical protein